MSSRPSSRASVASSSATSGGQRVRVAVRVRPPLQHEGQPECIICAEDGKRLTLDLDSQSWPQRGAGPRARSFAFDSIHDRSTTQEELFDQCGMPDLLDATLDGYTSTVFAYGQTGSGKSARASTPRALSKRALRATPRPRESPDTPSRGSLSALLPAVLCCFSGLWWGAACERGCFACASARGCPPSPYLPLAALPISRAALPHPFSLLLLIPSLCRRAHTPLPSNFSEQRTRSRERRPTRRSALPPPRRCRATPSPSAAPA